MTKYTLADAIGNINDRHIIETDLYQRKPKSKVWIITAAACVAVFFTTIPIYKFITSNNCAYPFWDIEANSYEEAVINFNDPLDDLLIDKLIIDGYSTDLDEYYSISIPKGKSNNRSNWDSLFACIDYTDNLAGLDIRDKYYENDKDFPWVKLTILLDYKKVSGVEYGFVADFKYGRYELSVEQINGYSVEYIAVECIDEEGNAATDKNGNIIVDYYNAHFTCNGGDEYYMFSNNLQLLLDTIKQMLS
ncbi:MAG: hypothetical protein HDT44_03405 [Ruminococcaceae bacterium]|nr:hypothetical protein [Oscillospiraceae bacterium]